MTSSPVFSTFAFLGVFLSLIPLPWHFQAWNSGTCYFMLWTSFACFNQFVNSIVWAGNALNTAPWWCEISIRILLGASVGIPVSSLCIVRRLHHIASTHTVGVSLAEKRRAILVDTLLCVLFPIIFVALQYIVQGHRFNIFEDIGCYPALYNTPLTYFISMMWPLLIGIITAVYCLLTLIKFNQRRIQFNQFLNSTTSLTVARYFRLMGLVTTEIMCTTPVAIFTIVLNATATDIGPWRSWEDTHFDYSRIEQFPAVLWRSNHLLAIAMELTRWLAPVSAIIFFLFFGFAEEARKNYRAAIAFILRRGKALPVAPRGLKALRITPTSFSSYDMKSRSPVTNSLKSHLSQSTLTSTLPSPKVDSSYLNKPIAHRQSDIPETAPAYSPTSATYLSSDVSTDTYYGDTHSLSSYSHPPILPVANLEPQGLSPPPRCPVIKPPFLRDLPSFADSIMMESPSRLERSQTVPEDIMESPPERGTLDIPGGILITVQTQASVDKMV